MFMLVFFFFKQSCSFVKCYFVGMTASAIPISQQLSAWAYTGLGLSTVNHRWVRGPFGPIPLCWNMSYWWILGGGVDIVFSCVPLMSSPCSSEEVANSCCTDSPCWAQWVTNRKAWVWERDSPGRGMERRMWRCESQNTLRLCTKLLQEQI